MTGYRCPYCGETIQIPQTKLDRIELFLRTFAECGHNQRITAERLGVSTRSVRLWLKELRLLGLTETKRATLSASLWSPAEEERMINLCREGKSYAEIGAIMGRTRDAVATKRNRVGKQRRAKCRLVSLELDLSEKQ